MQNGIQLACISNIGRVRGNNEDNFFFFGEALDGKQASLPEALVHEASEKSGCVVGVFDGMGGEADGQDASLIASNCLKKAIQYGYPEDINAFFTDLTRKMNHKVAAEADERFNHMGTTSVMLALQNGRYTVCNVGDSKAMILRCKELSQLSTDHSDKEFLELNQISGRKPALTQYVGIPEREFIVEPSLISGEYQEGDWFLLCSDGLTDMVTTDQIQQVLCESETPAACLQRLVELALAYGGRDNVTIITAKIG